MATTEAPVFERCLWPDCENFGLVVFCRKHQRLIPPPLVTRLGAALATNDQPAWKAAVADVRTLAANA